jgi:sugar phosphate isomerase/epimerase
MKLAVSSLAWDPSQDESVRALLQSATVKGVELAPLKYWPDAAAVGQRELAAYRSAWTDAGIAIVALQGILFGKPDLQLFGSSEQRTAFAEHLAGMAKIAEGLGASVMVLGAPKNRLRGSMPEDRALADAAESFRRVAKACADRGCILCIEPAPGHYGGDFVRNLAEGVALVRAVDHPGFGLHVDAGAIAICHETDEQVREALQGYARHFHISEVDLVPIGSGTVDHGRVGNLVRESRYDGWMSIEMKPVDAAALLAVIRQAVDHARGAYA